MEQPHYRRTKLPDDVLRALVSGRKLEAIELLRDAMAGWFESAVESGLAIPEPADETYSGRILLRVPKMLHRQLVRIHLFHLLMIFIKHRPPKVSQNFGSASHLQRVALISSRWGSRLASLPSRVVLLPGFSLLRKMMEIPIETGSAILSNRGELNEWGIDIDGFLVRLMRNVRSGIFANVVNKMF